MWLCLKALPIVTSILVSTLVFVRTTDMGKLLIVSILIVVYYFKYFEKEGELEAKTRWS